MPYTVKITFYIFFAGEDSLPQQYLITAIVLTTLIPLICIGASAFLARFSSFQVTQTINISDMLFINIFVIFFLFGIAVIIFKKSAYTISVYLDNH